MSNQLAIATATEALATLLWRATSIVPGSQVTHVRPDRLSDPHVAGINVFLYQVGPNAAFRNRELPVRADGTVVGRPRTAVQLHYLISFRGDDESLEPHRLLGAALSTLHEYPVLSPSLIRDLKSGHRGGGDPLGWLAHSDLDEQEELVRLTGMTLTIDEISKFWNVFFQTPYLLSIVVEASVLLIDGQELPVPVLPVLQVVPRGISGIPYLQLLQSAVSVGDTLIVRTDARPGWTLAIDGTPVTSTPVGADQGVLLDSHLVSKAKLKAGSFEVELNDPHGAVLARARAVLLPSPVNPTASGNTILLGIVPDPDPDQAVELRLVGRGGAPSRTLVATARPDQNGTWRFEKVEHGEYVVMVSVGGLASRPTWSETGARFEPIVEVTGA